MYIFSSVQYFLIVRPLCFFVLFYIPLLHLWIQKNNAILFLQSIQLLDPMSHFLLHNATALSQSNTWGCKTTERIWKSSANKSPPLDLKAYVNNGKQSKYP